MFVGWRFWMLNRRALWGICLSTETGSSQSKQPGHWPWHRCINTTMLGSAVQPYTFKSMWVSLIQLYGRSQVRGAGWICDSGLPPTSTSTPFVPCLPTSCLNPWAKWRLPQSSVTDVLNPPPSSQTLTLRMSSTCLRTESLEFRNDYQMNSFTSVGMKGSKSPSGAALFIYPFSYKLPSLPTHVCRVEHMEICTCTDCIQQNN